MALLRRMVIAVDPDAAARWYRKGVRDRGVTAYPAADGTITAHGLPPDEAEAACRRIQRLAAAAKRAGHPGRIGQIRADLFLGLLDGRFHGMTVEQVIARLIADHRSGDPRNTPAPADPATPDDSATSHDSATTQDGTAAHERSLTLPGSVAARWDDTVVSVPEPTGPEPDPTPDPAEQPGAVVGDQRQGVEIRVGLATLLGHDKHPAEIPGLGLILAEDARTLVAQQTRACWRFAVTHLNGTLLSEGLTRHRPTGANRNGPPGGIVELHVPESLLQRLAADPAAAGAWAPVVADIAAQHADRH